mgnify:CR=1 FL=1
MLSETRVVNLAEDRPKFIALRRLRGRLFLFCATLSLALFTMVSTGHSVFIGIDWRLFLIGIISISGALGIGTIFIEYNLWMMNQSEGKNKTEED